MKLGRAMVVRSGDGCLESIDTAVKDMTIFDAKKYFSRGSPSVSLHIGHCFGYSNFKVI